MKSNQIKLARIFGRQKKKSKAIPLATLIPLKSTRQNVSYRLFFGDGGGGGNYQPKMWRLKFPAFDLLENLTENFFFLSSSLFCAMESEAFSKSEARNIKKNKKEKKNEPPTLPTNN